MGISSILSTGEQALLAQQKALQVVGQNIANVNTPGYSRERPVLIPVPTALTGSVLRSGVSVEQVKRVFDRFVTTQIHTATTQLHSAQEQDDLLKQIEALFNDLGQEDAGLASVLEHFFQSFQELANNPQDMAVRTALQQQGTTVASTFQQLHTGLQDLRQDLNTSLQDELEQMNRLANQIADLNNQIMLVEADPNNPANTLRDERDQLVKQLAEKVDITTFETNEGAVTVLLGGGRPLVEGPRAQHLVTRADDNEPQRLLVYMQDDYGNLTNVTTNILGGKIQGLLHVRDTAIPQFTTSLNRLAAQLIASVNQLHSSGYGLDGTTGNAFFVPRQVTGQALVENVGDGTLQSPTVFDPTQLTLDEYRITFVANGPPPTFDIINTTTGTTVAAAQTYTSGAPIRFAGIETRLTNGSGPPQVGDTFLFSTTQDAAENIAMDAGILNDARKIAAAQTPTVGDNANALALAALRQNKVIDQATFEEFHHALLSTIGLQSQQSATQAQQQQLVVTEMENRRESLAGVSLDEEQIDLIRFQQAFNAAAHFIQVADELANVVLDMVQ
ncbi:MAG TPA: flagellar hook-associated protein FlgK [Candidatus Tectomicrobia bacterium]|jgi:flagellar hook-associated protein 1 FlgK